MNRRVFGATAAATAFSTLAPLIGRTRIVDVEDVWMGHGPLMIDLLIPGRLLAVEVRRGRVCGLLGKRFLGFLPEYAAAPSTVVEITSASVGSDGRLRIQAYISE